MEIKICKNGKLWGTNYSYDNPIYKEKQRQAKLGSNHPNWKGGIHKGNQTNQTKVLQQDYLKSDRNPFNHPKPHSEETKIKISKSNKGKIRSDEFKVRMRESMTLRWKNDRENIIKNSLKGLIKRPTSLEKNMLNLINSYNLPYKYVGDGSFLVGYKNPDFINVNGKKICIEVYHDYFKIRDYGSIENYEEQRIKHFDKYGWKTIIIREHELKNINHVLEKINKFEHKLGGN